MANVRVLMRLLDQLSAKYGCLVHDRFTGKCMDWGQAVCRYVYGAGWEDSQKFHDDNDRQYDNEGWIPDSAITAAQTMLEKLPEWVVICVSVASDCPLRKGPVTVKLKEVE